METEDRPPLEEIVSHECKPISASTIPALPLAVTPKILHMQLERLKPHFDDLQEYYFQLTSQSRILRIFPVRISFVCP
jgi:hypothetical protein